MKINFKTIEQLLNITENELIDFINQPFNFSLTKEEEEYLIYIKEFIKQNINTVDDFEYTLENRMRRHMIREELPMFCYWKRKCCLNSKKNNLLQDKRNKIIKTFDTIKNIKQ